MKKTILCTLCTVFSLTIWAQGGVNMMLATRGIESIMDDAFIPKYNLRDIEMRGSRYFNPEFVNGEIWMTNDKHFTTEMVYKFDELENSVHIRSNREKKKELLLPSNQVLAVRLFLEKDTFSFFRMEIPNDKEKKERLFMILYATPQYKLVKLPQKRYREINDKQPYGTGDQYKEFKSEHRYFLRKGATKQFEEINLSKKSLMKNFPNKKATLEKLFSKPEYKDLDEWNVAGILQELEKS
jgi:hypothetical protein